MFRHLACLAAIGLAACSGDRPPGVDAGAPDGGTDAPAPTGSLRALAVSVYAPCAIGLAAAECDASVEVLVYGEALARISDATVTVNDRPLAGSGDGTYREIHTGLEERYSVTATRGPDRIDATMASPSDFTWSIAPDPPRVGMPATSTWVPNGQPDVMVEVQVTRGGVTHFMMRTDDAGELTLPESAFPEAGTYGVSVTRQALRTGPQSGSVFSILLLRSASVTVP